METAAPSGAAGWSGASRADEAAGSSTWTAAVAAAPAAPAEVQVAAQHAGDPAVPGRWTVISSRRPARRVVGQGEGGGGAD